jgi:hypothetical protein
MTVPNGTIPENLRSSSECCDVATLAQKSGGARPIGVLTVALHPQDKERRMADTLSSQLATRPSVALLDALVADLRSLYAKQGLQLAVDMGRLIIDRLYDGAADKCRSHGRKDASFRALEQHPGLPFRASTLCRAVAIYRMSLRRPALLESRNVTQSHVQELLRLPPPEQDELLEKAERGEWTVKRIRAEVAERVESPPTAVSSSRTPRIASLLKYVSSEKLRHALSTPSIERLCKEDTRRLLAAARELCGAADRVVRQLAQHLGGLEHGAPDAGRSLVVPKRSGKPRSKAVVA